MNNTQHVKLPLHKYLTEGGERRVMVREDGKASHTVFRLLARWPEMSLLEAQLKTGRTHQIRVHLSHLGFPILGDEKYGDFALNKRLRPEGLKRMALHAWQMDFRHPLSGESMRTTAPLPAGIADYIAAVDAHEGREFAVDNLADWLAGKAIWPDVRLSAADSVCCPDHVFAPSVSATLVPLVPVSITAEVPRPSVVRAAAAFASSSSVAA